MAIAGFQGIDHIVISTANIEETMEFYASVLGWEPEWDASVGGPDDPDFPLVVGIEGAHGRAAGGRIVGHINNTRVEFTSMSFYPTQPRGEGLGLSIFTCAVTDAMKAYEDCLARGIKVIRGGKPELTKGCRIFFIEGPDSQVIEFVEFTADAEPTAWATYSDATERDDSEHVS